MSSVLKINQSYEPIEIINWEEAIRLIFLEKAEIVREYEDKFLHTTNQTFKMPAVIRLTNSFNRPRKRIKYNPKNIRARDRFQCQYCSKRFPSNELTLDHVIPRSQGGKTCWENIVSCCVDCNNKKRNRTPAQANMKLKKYPAKPDWTPIVMMSFSKNTIPPEWRDFCFFDEE